MDEALRHRNTVPENSDGGHDASAGDTVNEMTVGDTARPVRQATTSGDDDEENFDDFDDSNKPDLMAAEKFSQGSNYVPGFMKSLVACLPPRWVNFTVRLFTSILLLGSFSTLVYLGPLALVSLVLLLQFACFYEIINIGCVVYRSHDLPWFRVLSWYFLFCSNYFLFGENLITRFRLLLAKDDLLQPLIVHHHFLSFTFYWAGIVLFVLTLVKKHYMKQFTLFGWTHVTLLLVVWSSHGKIQNIFNGIIWFLLPVALVICNDIAAYVFGFFFGKTPLIKLSPKKTWEGFIGGGLTTMLFALFLSSMLLPYDYFVCPLEWDEVAGALNTNCTRNPVFLPRTYTLPGWMFLSPLRTITWYPFQWHSLFIALYTSVVGPFGGFFASGFKRAFRVKDFGDLLPGHGGFVDRFDCQLLVGVFVFIYYNSFVRVQSPSTLLYSIYVLPPAEQLDFYRLLTEGLSQRGLLPSDLVNTVVESIQGITGSPSTAI